MTIKNLIRFSICTLLSMHVISSHNPISATEAAYDLIEGMQFHFYGHQKHIQYKRPDGRSNKCSWKSSEPVRQSYETQSEISSEQISHTEESSIKSKPSSAQAKEENIYEWMRELKRKHDARRSMEREQQEQAQLRSRSPSLVREILSTQTNEEPQQTVVIQEPTNEVVVDVTNILQLTHNKTAQQISENLQQLQDNIPENKKTVVQQPKNLNPVVQDQDLVHSTDIAPQGDNKITQDDSEKQQPCVNQGTQRENLPDNFKALLDFPHNKSAKKMVEGWNSNSGTTVPQPESIVDDTVDEILINPIAQVQEAEMTVVDDMLQKKESNTEQQNSGDSGAVPQPESTDESSDDDAVQDESDDELQPEAVTAMEEDSGDAIDGFPFPFNWNAPEEVEQPMQSVIPDQNPSAPVNHVVLRLVRVRASKEDNTDLDQADQFEQQDDLYSPMNTSSGEEMSISPILSPYKNLTGSPLGTTPSVDGLADLLGQHQQK